MAISQKIIKYLEDNKYKYEIIEHKTTFTAWDTAQTEKIKPQEVVKALVMKVDNDYVLALIPANRNLDKQKLLKTINASRKRAGMKNFKKIDFAKEVWMKKNLQGKVGAVPPFNKLLKIGIFIDSLLTKNKKIYLGSGEYVFSIRVNASQYLKIEQPIKGVFSKKKS
ncbi:MAG: YbaK/EbsC family protein [Parcubacteria group bacterium]|jgi:Ala-tRNA(Pro) deacylase